MSESDTGAYESSHGTLTLVQFFRYVSFGCFKFLCARTYCQSPTHARQVPRHCPVCSTFMGFCTVKISIPFKSTEKKRTNNFILFLTYLKLEVSSVQILIPV